MRTKQNIKVEVVDTRSPHLARVKELHRANAGRLGMFPSGAFEEYATLHQIVGAVNSVGQCVGYLLYRVAKQRAMIVHLCVDREWQNQGVSRVLVERLATVTKERGLQGIGLRCRRDYYDANRAWQRLGFVPLNDKPGRGFDGKELTFWWYNHKQPDLFAISAASLPEDDRLVAVLDANVFFDLYDENDPESDESKALRADWLQDAVDFCLTNEIFTEINRNDDKTSRDRQRVQAQRSHRILEPEQAAVETAQSSIRHLFPKALDEADESDVRQLSKTIAEGVSCFVTRDERILAAADNVFDAVGVSMLRPTALINRLDSLRRAGEYQPVRLGGSRFKVRRVSSPDEERLKVAFQAAGKGENAPTFLKAVRRLLATPQVTECFVAESDQQEPLALYGVVRQDRLALDLPLVRVGRGTLAPTLARHLLAKALQTSADEGRMVTTLSEPHLDVAVMNALEEAGFACVDGVWMKLNLGEAATAHDLTRILSEIAAANGLAAKLASKFAEAMQAWQASPDVSTAIALERALWPAKIVNADVPCFIVPIQPNWAQSLFDEGLANQELFGQRPELVLKREQVYYRANQPCGLAAPGRIVWYVSSDASRQGTMSIRACSRLDEIVVEKPKELYRRFRRLGVYEWRDIAATAKHDFDQPIMALRFADTELFRVPIPRERFRKLGIKSNLQSPLRITKDQFADIYRLGNPHT